MKIIRGLVAAVLILAIGAVVLVVALPGEKIAKLAADQVKAMTGRELTFEGKVGIRPISGCSSSTPRRILPPTSAAPPTPVPNVSITA